MSRTLARRGASVLVAAAVLGGGLGLGGGAASAAESSSAPVGSVGGVVDLALLAVALGSLLGLDSALGAVGSVEPGNVWTGCAANCPPPGTPIGSIAWDDWINGRPPGTSMPDGGGTSG
ncbi:hypothetical protein [Rhodococcus maanshanensis]|uniref:Uncharacterized protein n=1 Tax=Rhodococcus maanshanensis TaxID=183556 RepID=A0A1H7W364_9NOCA|nr:hypothetical protein [Rhodococcus maanshanensis]SEM15911.1 hypothetical protein SAMN05444583_12461 [Rhodococcus maanshanensis]